MNLQTAIEVYAGGPGSGCNPATGKCGRPKLGAEDLKHWRNPTKLKDDPDFEIRRVHPRNLILNSPRIGGEDDERKSEVTRYARNMQKGTRFPVIDVVPIRRTPGRYRVVDGNHRFLAWKSIGGQHMPVKVYKRS